MKLGILLCDDVRPELQTCHGNYPEMFTRLFERIDTDVKLHFYRVTDGQYPQSLDECDAYLASGSRFSVYNESRWITVFKAFINRLYRQKIPFVGICFGHQMLAWALGGEVTRSINGWGIGVHQANIVRHQITQHRWLADIPSPFSLLVSHQDQITEPPLHTTVLASSDFCPYAMILVGDHSLGIQGHPEFTPEYSHDLITLRQSNYSVATFQTAIASLEYPTDHDLLTRGILRFIRSC
ncbi:glutamine amidotransferase-related protein [Photobacterium nomapromontoriensis]|uniref:glutamine amidotransferase-related protein n=1 Tax=Photobacterium nomapromontoriensis TaxID=2910237 RepID=UPI003D114308